MSVWERAMLGASLGRVGEQPFSVRERQKRVLVQMLQSASEGAWKVLVFDDRGGDIMYLLMRVKDLRRAGVTLSLRLEDRARQRLDDVPAVYFVVPTAAALDAIAKDLGSRALYSSACVHAVSAFQKTDLEALARAAVREGCAGRITRVYDQYADYLALEDDLFVTGRCGGRALGAAEASQLTYSVFNGTGVPDAAVAAAVEATARSLFGVVLALGAVPIIRAPRNTAAAAVAEALHRMLQRYIASAASGAADTGALLASAALQRPLLVICDRNADLGVMLAHPWHYRGLVSELLDFDLNKATITHLTKNAAAQDTQQPPAAAAAEATAEGEWTVEKLKKPLEYELDTRTDRFWAAQCGAAFPEMAVCLHNEVKGYKVASDEISRYSRGADVSELGDSDDLAQRGLARFAERMPQLRETKTMIDAHTTIANELLMRIKRARVDEFFELEDGLLRANGSPSSDTTARVRSIVCARSPYALADRVRLFLVWYLSVSGAAAEAATAEARAAMEQALTAAGADMRPFAYAQRIKAFMASASSMGGSGSSSGGDVNGDGSGGSSSSSSARLVSAAFERLMSGVKALMPRNEKYRVARVVEALMDLRGAALGVEDEYMYLDPKLPCEQLGPNAAHVPRKTTPFKDAVVFVVGGGNYVEHQNVVDLCRKQSGSGSASVSPSVSVTPPLSPGAAPAGQPEGGFVPTGKRIIYGTTEMLTPAQFLEQLALLG